MGHRRETVYARPVYTIPDPLYSFEDAQRFSHEDLPALDDFEIWAELRRVERALSCVKPGAARDWLAERRCAVEAERRSRP